MMVSDEEKRWLVVGISMNKVAAPVLRDFIQQGLDTQYTNNTYCHGLTTPCTMAKLTYHHVNADPNLKRLKFQNINNNLHNHGNHKNLYNYNISSSVDLAKLFLPDYLAEFSAFDESLDMSAMLRLLGFNNPAPIFLSPNPLISIQTSADDVRVNCRNKWGHCNVTEWTEVLFNDCFSKLETLVRSLGLTGGAEKTTLDQLTDWQTKGCQLCMGHAVDQNLLSLVQQYVQELIKKLKKTKAEQTANQEATKLQLEEHDEELKGVLEWREQQMKENEIILVKLVALEELWPRLQVVEANVSEVKAQISQTDEKVKQLEENVRDLTVKDDRPTNSTVGSFDVKTCRSKLAEHYKRTAKVPTSVWSKKSPVDIHQIYTRLSWVKEEQTPAGSSKSKLGHYRDLFTADEKGVERKRILVQGQTGIGKSTFVKKLAVDWVKVNDEKTEGNEQKRRDDEGTSSTDDEDISSDEFEDSSTNDASNDENRDMSSDDTSSEEYKDRSGGDKYENQAGPLKKFELVLVVNLKEASKCPSLKDVIRCCHIFPEEDTALVEGLLNYVTKNQEKVLLVFDSYDEYHCGSNSEIYEIFRGNKLRNCCVLITTRISKADDLREFKDVHAEITGFSKEDSNAFMRRMLGGEEEAKELRRHLSQKRLIGLTRVPLLLFFCTLLKKGKLKSFPETKTKLYLAIVQYVLDYSQGKHSPARFRKVEDFKEILAEIGQVALECLLKDDHVFEFDQLSATILCDESLIIGLLQVTEYAEDIRPAGMVSFIHKSIQEFLAAWYITYRCVPEGNLGRIEQHARTLKDCEALENVFQFICGLSDDGAVKVFQHFASVSISDPTLDLLDFSAFWTIPDVEKEFDVPPCDITATHWRFSDLVYSSFQEVSSKAELFSSCLECTSRMVYVTEQVFGFLQAIDVKELTQCMFSGKCHLQQHSLFRETLKTLCKLMEILNLPGVLPSAAESSKLLTKRNGKRMLPSCWCSFSYILLFRSGQFQFYITDLNLDCDEHARLFTEPPTDSNPCLLKKLCSGQSCLQFLTSLEFYAYPGFLSDQTCLALSAAIRNCRHLNSIEVQECNDSICDLLEQVPNPSKCSLEVANCKLKTAGALKLASLLSAFSITTTLELDFGNCCFPALDALFTRIADKCLTKLTVAKLRLTEAVATALGEALPRLYSLETFELTGSDGSILASKEIEALFGGFNKILPLTELTFSGFNVTGCLAPFFKSFRFFPGLKELELEELHLDEHHLCGLLGSLQFMPNLKTLSIESKPVSQEHCCTAEVNTSTSITHKSLKQLHLDGINLKPAVAKALGQLLPEMLSLEEFKLTGVDGSILETKEIEALFGGFYKALPITNLSFNGFSVAGCLAPLFKSFRFLPDLKQLELEEFHLDEHHMCGLLESLQFLPNLKTLSIESKPLSQEHCCTAEVNTSASIIHKSLEELKLDGINLTPAVAAALGQLLPQMLSLQTILLTGADGSILTTREIEAMFGGFNKAWPLTNLSFSGLSVAGCLAPLFKSFRFFPDLNVLELEGSHLDEIHMCTLLESLQFLPNLKTLSVESKPLISQEHCCTVEVNTLASITHKSLEELNLDGISLTTSVAAVLGQLLPEMSSLQQLELTGTDGSILETKEIEALFGGFNKALPLTSLSLNGFSVAGCLAPLFKRFRFFPDLRQLGLGGFRGEFQLDEHHLCGLLESLQFMPNLKTLNVKSKPLSQEHSCTMEVNTLDSITPKSLEEMYLDGINLTPAVAAALGQLLPEMSSLQQLELTGADGSILETNEMKALFGRLNTTLPLTNLSFSGFNVTGCLAPLIQSFRFFPNLRTLKLGGYREKLKMDEHHFFALMESLQFLPNLKTLSVKSQPPREEHSCTVEINSLASIAHKSLEELNLDGISLTPAVAAALGQLLPEMSSLQDLKLTGADGSILTTEEMKVLFGGFNKTLPLTELTFGGFVAWDSLSPLIKSFRFFPDLKELNLEMSDMDEHYRCPLLENFGLFRDLTALSMRIKYQDSFSFHCYTSELFSVTRDRIDKRLELDVLHMTPGVAAALGRSLPELTSLETLELRADGSILTTKDMEALFGGFNKRMPLTKLTVSGFSVTGCLTPLIKSFRFFPDLRELEIGEFNLDERHFLALIDSSQLMSNLKTLSVESKPLSQEHCCIADVDTLASITHKSLEKLKLDGINMTTAVAAVLSRLLPEMSSLQELELIGADGSILQAEEIRAIFGGFNTTLPLTKLFVSGLSVIGCPAQIIKSFRFFPDLRELGLERFSLDERHFFALMEGLKFMPHLKTLSIESKALSQEHSCTVEVNKLASITHKGLEELRLDGINLTPAVATALGQLVPEMSPLDTFDLTGADGSILTTKEIEALFGRFNKALPLTRLTFSGFSVTGCLTPLIKSFRFFPDLRELEIEEFHMDEKHFFALMDSLQFMPNLKTLSVESKPLSQEHSCAVEVNTLASITHKSIEELYLVGINLTPAVAAALGQLLPEMSSLQELRLTVADGSILETKEMEALFNGFNKALPLTYLSFSGFSVTGCLAPLIKSFRFFPDLRELEIEEFNLDERHFLALMDSLQFIPSLKTLSVESKPLSQEHCCTAEVNTLASITHKSLEKLNLNGINLTPAVATALGQLLPEMSSLQELELTGADGSILTTKDMEALFGGFYKTLPLTKLTFRCFNAIGCLAPLIKSFCFFPGLGELQLGWYGQEIHTDGNHFRALLESLKCTPNLKTLSVESKPLGHHYCCIEEVNTFASITHKNLEEINLDGLSLSQAVATVLGGSLSEMSVQELELAGVYEGISQIEEMKTLLGEFNGTMPLYKLTFSGFSVTGCLAPRTSLCFFPNLRQLKMDEHAQGAPPENFGLFDPSALTNGRKYRDSFSCHNYISELNTLFSVTRDCTDKRLNLGEINLTPELAQALGRSLLKLSSMKTSELTGADESILTTKELEALLGGFTEQDIAFDQACFQ